MPPREKDGPPKAVAPNASGKKPTAGKAGKKPGPKPKRAKNDAKSDKRTTKDSAKDTKKNAAKDDKKGTAATSQAKRGRSRKKGGDPSGDDHDQDSGNNNNQQPEPSDLPDYESDSNSGDKDQRPEKSGRNGTQNGGKNNQQPGPSDNNGDQSGGNNNNQQPPADSTSTVPAPSARELRMRARDQRRGFPVNAPAIAGNGEGPNEHSGKRKVPGRDAADNGVPPSKRAKGDDAGSEAQTKGQGATTTDPQAAAQRAEMVVMPREYVVDQRKVDRRNNRKRRNDANPPSMPKISVDPDGLGFVADATEPTITSDAKEILQRAERNRIAGGKGWHKLHREVYRSLTGDENEYGNWYIRMNPDIGSGYQGQVFEAFQKDDAETYTIYAVKRTPRFKILTGKAVEDTLEDFTPAVNGVGWSVEFLDGGRYEMAKDEVRALSLLSPVISPLEHVVAYKAHAKTPSHVWMFMEKMTGNLEELLEMDEFNVNKSSDQESTWRLRSKTLWDAFHHTLLGLEQVHKSDLVHHDINFRNILYRRAGQDYQFKIADFGYAKSKFQHVGILQPSYLIAPELVKTDLVGTSGRRVNGMKGYYCFESDAWSLFCAFYLAMRRPDPYYSELQAAYTDLKLESIKTLRHPAPGDPRQVKGNYFQLLRLEIEHQVTNDCTVLEPFEEMSLEDPFKRMTVAEAMRKIKDGEITPWVNWVPKWANQS